MGLPGSELYWDPALGFFERWYCRVFGAPIIGLRIRMRWLQRLLPPDAKRILDAGCGRGVISRMLARRYGRAEVDAVDLDFRSQERNRQISACMKLSNCHFLSADLAKLDADDRYDLVVSVDNLEHIDDDLGVLRCFNRAMSCGGVLVVHVPHYYRRWPAFKWLRNFDVPGHIRAGYHLPEIIERVRKAGFSIERAGFSYGFLENLANNLGYAITAAEEKHKMLYAALFPVLNALAWLGHRGNPAMGAGAWVVARKLSADAVVSEPEEFADVE
jgi:SAM-dependent methyltransferase